MQVHQAPILLRVKMIILFSASMDPTNGSLELNLHIPRLNPRWQCGALHRLRSLVTYDLNCFCLHNSPENIKEFCSPASFNPKCLLSVISNSLASLNLLAMHKSHLHILHRQARVGHIKQDKHPTIQFRKLHVTRAATVPVLLHKIIWN